MTLEKIYNKWLSIQPLSEADQNKLSIRFTVEYNYNSNHLEGNTLTYGQTELLLLFGKVSGEGHLKDFNDMKASEVSVKLMKEEAANKKRSTNTKFHQKHFIILCFVRTIPSIAHYPMVCRQVLLSMQDNTKLVLTV